MQRVVPAGAAGVEGSSLDPFVLGGFEGRTQVLIGRSWVGQLATTPIRRIVLRRDAQTNDRLPAGMKGGWIDLTVLASWTPRSFRNPSPRFAANHDPRKPPAVVYRGLFRVIDSPRLRKGTKVASFAPGVSAHILLQTPIAPAAAGDLCLDFVYRRDASKTPPAVWVVDAMDVHVGPKRVFGRSCWRTGKKDGQTAVMDPSAAVGGSLTCATSGPRVPFGLLAVGASTTQWGPLRLPFDLGVLGAPGCFLYVSRDLVLLAALRPSPSFPSTRAQVELQLPLAATLVGARIHSQWMFYQPGANRVGITTTNGASVDIGATPAKLGAAMLRALDPGATSGRVWVDRAPVLLLASR